jgi:hypothetical protein
MFACAVPACLPQLPANLKGDERFSGAGGHRNQDVVVALEDGFDRAVDRDLLVVALALALGAIEGGQ